MEKKVASTLLEEAIEIVIGGERYEMRPPSIATLVKASSYIKELPSEKLEESRLVSEMIQVAENITPIGYAMATMILGVEEFEKLEKKSLKSFFSKREKQGYKLAQKINNADVKEVLSSFYKLLENMNLSSFFQLTTFLIELNLTKPTKKVVD